MNVKWRIACFAGVAAFLLAGHAEVVRNSISAHDCCREMGEALSCRDSDAQLCLKIVVDTNGSNHVVKAFVCLKSNSKSVLRIVETSPEKDYSFAILDPLGVRMQKVEVSGFGEVFRRRIVVIPPGESVSAEVDLGSLFRFSRQGRYVVRVFRSVFKEGDKAAITLVSDATSFVVRP